MLQPRIESRTHKKDIPIFSLCCCNFFGVLLKFSVVSRMYWHEDLCYKAATFSCLDVPSWSSAKVQCQWSQIGVMVEQIFSGFQKCCIRECLVKLFDQVQFSTGVWRITTNLLELHLIMKFDRSYRVSENDFGNARRRNPSKAYWQYVVEDFDR